MRKTATNVYERATMGYSFLSLSEYKQHVVRL